jgi:hypothetical protein
MADVIVHIEDTHTPVGQRPTLFVNGVPKVVAFDDKGQPLSCYGCAHSASNMDGNHPFPGNPSGERPCMFCVRNTQLGGWVNKDNAKWYDGSEPVKCRMDCYHTCDMKDQIERWITSARRAGKRFIKGLVK